MTAIEDALIVAYPWTLSLHVMSMIAWMAGIFYLPRLFVYHAEQGHKGAALTETLTVMERKLLKLIVNPAGVSTWVFGLALVLTPGIVDWGSVWPYAKGAAVVGMTWFHHALVRWQRRFERGENQRPGRYYRMMNEVPTVLMIVIVVMVIVRPF